MGKGGKGKQVAEREATSSLDDDELLNQAIAENLAIEEKRRRDQADADAAKQKARAEEIAKQVAIAKRDRAGAPLSKSEIADKLNAIPCFTIVDTRKQFVPLRMKTQTGITEDCCFFWAEPDEAKSALMQAKSQRSESEEALALGTFPLGKAFALCEGWAEASTATGASCKYRLQAHSRMVEALRPQLARQLQHVGMDPSDGVFPVFLCEELTTDTVMPCFLSRADVVSTWENAVVQAGHDLSKATPPSKITVLDLRMLAHRMQSGGMDWSTITFVGTDRAFEVGSTASTRKLCRVNATLPIARVRMYSIISTAGHSISSRLSLRMPPDAGCARRSTEARKAGPDKWIDRST